MSCLSKSAQISGSIKEPSRWMTLLSSAYLIDRASATVSASMLPTELVSGTSFPFINDRHIISESFLSIHFHTFGHLQTCLRESLP